MATIRIDDKLKKEADKKFESAGMNTAGAVKIFLTKFVKTGRFPFEIESLDYEPNEETMNVFKETEEMVKAGKFDNKESLNDMLARLKREAVEEEHAEL